MPRKESVSALVPVVQIKGTRDYAAWYEAEVARLGLETRADLYELGVAALVRDGVVSRPPARARPFGTNRHGEPKG